MEESSWYEKYLPFVARSPEMQLRWLEAAFRKGALSLGEITPYIRLFMASDGEERPTRIRVLINSLSGDLIGRMLDAAEVYDVPALFRCIAAPVLAQAVLAISKAPPPYEKNPQAVMEKIFQAVYDVSEDLLDEAAAVVLGKADCPAGFKSAYERFKEVKEDEKLLSALYPKAIM